MIMNPVMILGQAQQVMSMSDWMLDLYNQGWLIELGMRNDFSIPCTAFRIFELKWTNDVRDFTGSETLFNGEKVRVIFEFDKNTYLDECDLIPFGKLLTGALPSLIELFEKYWHDSHYNNNGTLNLPFSYSMNYLGHKVVSATFHTSFYSHKEEFDNE